jgi:hypothetical protein
MFGHHLLEVPVAERVGKIREVPVSRLESYAVVVGNSSAEGGSSPNFAMKFHGRKAFGSDLRRSGCKSMVSRYRTGLRPFAWAVMSSDERMSATAEPRVFRKNRLAFR